MSTFTLAFRNVRKSYKDYGVYFLTIIVGVAIFYIFNSLDSSSAMLKLSEQQAASLLGVNIIMSTLSVFISAILAFLILYANAFLIRRRKKELGIYMTLGMRKSRISRILICETMFVGLISLIVGLVLGILLSQALALLTAKLFEVSVTGFAFVFSAKATLKSIIYFGVAFVLVMLFNTVNISRYKLLDLIYADRKASVFCTPRFSISVALFIVSLVLISAGYAVILRSGILNSGKSLSVSIVLGVAGTFLFFYSFAGFLLKVVQKKQKVYFKGLNLFTIGQLNSRMNTAHISMSFVCLMMFVAISAISVGSSIVVSISSHYTNESGTIAAVIFTSLYIGIMFILAGASTLAISQLSEASDNRSRFKLLSKLGASTSMLSVSLLKQISFCFLLPLELAIVHSIVAIIVMSDIIYAIGNINIMASCLASGLLIVALYGGYFLMTYFGARHILLRRN